MINLRRRVVRHSFHHTTLAPPPPPPFPIRVSLPYSGRGGRLADTPLIATSTMHNFATGSSLTPTDTKELAHDILSSHHCVATVGSAESCEPFPLASRLPFCVRPPGLPLFKPPPDSVRPSCHTPRSRVTPGARPTRTRIYPACSNARAGRGARLPHQHLLLHQAAVLTHRVLDLRLVALVRHGGAWGGRKSVKYLTNQHVS